MILSPATLQKMKGQQAITILTAYTAPIAGYVERAGVPVILVGDTLAMVEMGFNNTRSVTIEHMQYHIGAVRRGAPNTHIIGDMTYRSYDTPEDALDNAHKLIDAGANSVKLEGLVIEQIQHLIGNEIDVVGHTGLTPQTASNFKQAGSNKEDAQRVLSNAQTIADAGVFMLVLEHIPKELAQSITESISIPTIGIGAGGYCDGQVLVINDLLGIGDYWPPFSKQYAQVGRTVEKAIKQFKQDVESKKFP